MAEMEVVGDGPLVLVVDDDEDIRDLITATLGAYHNRVLTAKNGEQARELYDIYRDRIVCVSTDMEMETPHAGLDLATQLRNQGYTGDIIFFTGTSLLPGELTALHATGIQKPDARDVSGKITDAIRAALQA